MSQIKIDPGSLSSIRSQFASAQTQMDDIGNRVMRISQSLDWEVKAKEQVNENLSLIKKNVSSHGELLGRYAAAIDTTSSKLTETDSSTASKVENINGVISTISWAGSAVNILDPSIFEIPAMVDYIPLFITGLSASEVLGFMKGRSSDMRLAPKSWEVIKDIYEFFDGSDTVAKNWDTLFGDSSIGDYLEKITDNKAFKGVGYAKDIEKCWKALKKGNFKDLLDVGVKYTKKGLKKVGELVGYATEEAAAYINLAFEFGENVLDIDKYAGLNSSYSTLGGLAAYAWHCTGEVFTDYAFDTAFGVAEGIDAFFGTNFAGYYEDNFGSADAEGMYKAFGSLIDGFKEVTVGQFVDSAVEYIGDSVSNLWHIFTGF